MAFCIDFLTMLSGENPCFFEPKTYLNPNLGKGYYDDEPATASNSRSLTVVPPNINSNGSGSVTAQSQRNMSHIATREKQMQERLERGQDERMDRIDEERQLCSEIEARKKERLLRMHAMNRERKLREDYEQRRTERSQRIQTLLNLSAMHKEKYSHVGE